MTDSPNEKPASTLRRAIRWVVVAILLGLLAALGQGLYDRLIDVVYSPSSSERYRMALKEIKIRAAAAESLLRTPCIADSQLKLRAAYNFLNDPSKNTNFFLDRFAEPVPKYRSTPIHDIIYELSTLLEDVGSNYVEVHEYGPSDRASLIQLENESVHLVQRYEPTIVQQRLNRSSGTSQTDVFDREVHSFYRGIHDVFTPFFENRFISRNEDIKFEVESAVLAEFYELVSSFDRFNKGYWWKTCLDQAVRCQSVLHHRSASPPLAEAKFDNDDLGEIATETKPDGGLSDLRLYILNSFIEDFVRRHGAKREEIYKARNRYRGKAANMSKKEKAENVLRCAAFVREVFPVPDAKWNNL